MGRRLRIKGDIVRQERQKKAWTQEKLSEVSRLGLRTLRRLESGEASLESLRKVSEALEMEPEAFIVPKSEHIDTARDHLPIDLLCFQFATSLCRDSFIQQFLERVSNVRRFLAHELGYLMPGVRFRDNINVRVDSYQLLVRNHTLAEGELKLGQWLAIGGELEQLPGTLTADPTYRMPAKWVPRELKNKAEEMGCTLFDPVSVVATHLTNVVRQNAHRLLGIQEIWNLLEDLGQPRLVEVAVPDDESLIELRTILRALLREQTSIRDLGLILDTLLDCRDLAISEKIGVVRVALTSEAALPELPATQPS